MPNLINGTSGADALNGLSGDNTIDGLGGADKINGGAARDTLNGNQGNDTISGNSGDDLLIYRVGENGGATDVYDGGSGKDFLQIELSLAQWLNPAFQADLPNYLTFLNLNTHWKTEEANNSIFKFSAFDLSVSKVEWLKVLVDGVEMSPEDNPVTLVADEIQANEDTAVTLNLMANDTVADQAASFSKTAPSHGTVGVVTDFSVVNQPKADATYTADAAYWNYLAVDEVGNDSFTYTVFDADGDQATQTVTVKIQGRNDPLSITSGSQAGTVVEDAPTTPTPSDALTATGLITFTDPDLTDVHSATVTTTPPGALGSLTLTSITEAANTATGSLSWTYTLDNAAAQSLGADAVNTETFVVTIADAHGSSKTQSVTVTIKGTNDEPTITVGAGNSDAASINETNAGLTASGTLTVTDVDVGDVLTYSVESLSKGGNGVTAVPDATLKGFMSFGAGTWSFDSGSEAFNSLAAGTNLILSYVLKVADNHGGADTQTVTVTINGVNDAPTAVNLSASTVAENAAGAIIGNLTTTDPDAGDTHTYTVSDARFEVVGGQLKLKAGQSLDFETEASVNLSVTSTDAGGLSKLQAFTITVTNVNEAPTAVNLSASTVAENAAGAIIGNLTTTDPDAGDTHTYTVSDARFEVVGGQLKLKPGQSLNFEAEASVNVDVTSTDAGELSKLQAFVITVTNVNEAPTAVNLSASTVAENAAGAVIGNLTTTDPDAGDTHTYTVSDARFEVVGGQLKLKPGQSLNFEAEPSVNVDVTSTDAGGLSKLQAFTITVTNVNEAPTAVNLSASTVAENAAGAVIGNLTTTDPDAGDTHTYTVSDARFEVVGGQLKLKPGQSLNFEAEPSVNVDVTSTDAGGLSKLQAFVITVTNVNEAPTAVNLSASTVAENAAGAVIGNLTTTDPDAGDTHTYTVSDARFEVVGGQLKLKPGQSLNFEAEPSVNVDVTSTDAGGLSKLQAFTITVTNVNEAPTAVNLSASTVAENAAGAVIGNLTTTDPDAGDTHTYTVSDARFEVVGGQLKLKPGQSLNFEAEASVNVDVTSTDAGGLSKLQAFVITVTNVNEAPTAVNLSASTVAENAAGAIIGNLTTTDPDAGDTHTYTVSDARFEVVAGQLKLKPGQSLNFEAEASVNVDVTSTDAGGLSKLQAFVITVTNVNEAPTAVNLSASTVAENAAGAIIGNLTTTDPDAGDTHSYTVSDARFEVVGGQLKLKPGQSLNFEAEPSVNVDVTSTDAGGLSKLQAFVITVTNVNEAPTAVNLSASTVAENAAGAIIGNLTTTDPDAGDTHSYTVNDARFEVVGGQLKLKPGQSLNFEAEPSVNVDVTSTDAGGLSKLQAFVITVTNVNEAPTAVNLSASTVAENAAGAIIGNLTTTDPDAGDTHTYTVSDARFEVVGGQLKLKPGQSLDFETEASVNLNVTSTDAGGLSKLQAFVITVTNVNEGAALPPASGDPNDPNNQDNDGLTAAAGSVGGNDTLVGTSGANTLNSGNGNDLIFGGAGNDVINGGGDNDTVYGQGGNDTVDGGNNLDAAYGGSGDDVIEGSNGNDLVYGGSGNDTTNETGSGDDKIFGGSGSDSINAGSGADTLVGGYGADTLDGGSGNDRFEYSSVLDTDDRILNFAAGDVIDLSGIDANDLGPGNPAFVGLTANSNQLVAFGASWFESGGNTILIADTDGDPASAEFMITIVGVGHSLSAGGNVIL